MSATAIFRNLVEGTPWEKTAFHPLRNDASKRRYWRAEQGGHGAIFMDSSNDEPVELYIRIADLMRRAGVRTPSIYRYWSGARIALIEDLGDAVVTEALAQGEDEWQIYACAIDNICALQRLPPDNGLPYYDDAFYRHELSIYLQNGCNNRSEEAEDEYWDIWAELLPKLTRSASAFVHRDFHVDNLIWLRNGENLNRLGILDFQGARRGHQLYDVMSLLEDVRRRVPETLRNAMLKRYLESNPDLRSDIIGEDYSILSAQRNFKILGLVERLAALDGRPEYRLLTPQVRAALERALSHPSLAPLRCWYHEHDSRR